VVKGEGKTERKCLSRFYQDVSETRTFIKQTTHPNVVSQSFTLHCLSIQHHAIIILWSTCVEWTI